MADLKLRYAGVGYYDKTRALEHGEVSPEGIELEYIQYDHVGKLFQVVSQDPKAYDASEFSLSTLALMTSRGDNRLVGIPVFPSKAFRHSQVYVNAASGISKPEDLAGRRVGIPEYQMTAAVWIRAFLQHDYGVMPSSIHWLTGGQDVPFQAERLHHEPPPGVTIDPIPAGETLNGMLESGTLDALVTARQPVPFQRGAGVVRLFPDYRSVEQDYLRRTGFFPIMHLITLQRELYEANPAAPLALLEAFEESKRRGRERLRDLDTLAVMHPWVAAELEELKESFSAFGGDPFVYGVGPNRHVLEAALDYSFEQGLSERRVGVEELFAPETLDWMPAGIGSELIA
ncbi:MAG TPA: hypothetical protein VH063_13700 [Gaiellaceae bacterium]|jgi:4,5-dihydroxyphthalate decarboxylase|nr:hypothetical protein [Gaiellaceae bacterium]